MYVTEKKTSNKFHGSMIPSTHRCPSLRHPSLIIIDSIFHIVGSDFPVSVLMNWIVSARELCVSRAQHSQQQHAGGVLRDLAPGEPVWARSFRQPDKWLKGTVANNQGTNRYVVNSGDGRLIPRHIDQIRRRSRMSNVPCPSGTNSDQFEGQVSISSEDALADSNIPDVGSNDDFADAISVTKHPITRREFEQSVDRTKIPTYEELMAFVEKQARVLEMSEVKVGSQKNLFLPKAVFNIAN
ncbi:hypothetical protein ACJJTC_002144 [Scirpophaga incertulas]